MHRPLSFKPFMSRTAAQKFEVGHIGKVPALRPPLRVSITHTLHERGTGLREKVCLGDSCEGAQVTDSTDRGCPQGSG